MDEDEMCRSEDPLIVDFKARVGRAVFPLRVLQKVVLHQGVYSEETLQKELKKLVQKIDEEKEYYDGKNSFQTFEKVIKVYSEINKGEEAHQIQLHFSE